MVEIKRTIEDIFNNDTGKDEKASTILLEINDPDGYVDLRRDLRERNKKENPRYLCEECGTPLELSCTPNYKGGHTFYFKHLKDPGFDKCSIKTGVALDKKDILRKQYEFKSESNAHKMLKKRVGEIIRKYICSEVIVDKNFILDRFGDKERRKPDIYFKYKNREITLEFQINNTFHSVIQEREEFYERNKISLMWIFGEFDPFSFQSITIKDIYVPNGNNAFVFDDEAEWASYDQNILCLKVWYKKYEIKNELVEAEWQHKIITIDQVKYDPETGRPYYFDCCADKKQKEDELKSVFKERQRERNLSFAREKANEIKNFLSQFRMKDYIPYEYELMLVNSLNPLECEVLNDVLDLNKTFKNGNNVIQLLLKEKLNHRKLVSFLLKAKGIQIPLQLVNDENETALITIKKAYPNSRELAKLLFSRGYKMNQLDKEFFCAHYSELKQKELLFLYSGFEKLSNFSQMEFFETNLNKFLVIESAKNGKLTILGNEKQSLVWMANLAAERYSEYWYFFDRAFKFYGQYERLFIQDKNGTFRKNYEKLISKQYPHRKVFEKVIGIFYPEILL